METGCQGGQGSPRAVAPGGWMDGPVRRGRLYTTDSKRNLKLSKKYLIFCGFGIDGYY